MKKALILLLACILPLTVPAFVDSPGESLTLSVSLNKDSVAAGDAITGTWKATGGTPPYSYHVQWEVGNTPDLESQIAEIIEDTRAESGSYVPRVAIMVRFMSV